MYNSFKQNKMKTAKQDNEIMKILKVSEISRIICDTNMGTLKLRIRKGETNYQFLLDAVELPKDMNKELMEAIYPISLSTPSNKIYSDIAGTYKPVAILTNNEIKIVSAKPKGRPKG